MLRVGLDIGSTTIKCLVLDENNDIKYTSYERHLSQITDKATALLKAIGEQFPTEKQVCVSISGSAGMGLAQQLGVPFVQEVYATRLAVKRNLPDTDVVIELGGEDAKILFVSGLTEVRMNGSCAGGTGAFIDQMATLLHISPTELNDIAKQHKKLYNIASRCGVFAKSDIQPLLNQGAKKEDVAASILSAVVSQTIAGLAQGRKIKGNVVYLGGPLSFFSELRGCFDTALGHKGTLPDNALYYVALGAALSDTDAQPTDLLGLCSKIVKAHSQHSYNSCEPLFKDQDEYNHFANRHGIGKEITTHEPCGKAYLGIDAGSTTLKAVLLNEQEQIICYKYMQNGGTPVPLVKQFLLDVYKQYPDIEIAGFATTGYGEQIIKNAFMADDGIVETVAHLTAAKKYNPKVDFIIDIGGQDIKCFKIRNGSIDNIFLNEACSSGCGSFLQTFAEALGENIADFAKLGLFAQRPVDLGSRCTVFMNSSVKQAQKDGATIENISAGLSISVVKNAIYKVIRAASADSLGHHIVVQGGTFLNDAVLRSFENEIGRHVTRPNIAGLMGAFGAALYIKNPGKGTSDILNAGQLSDFYHEVKSATCGKCTNKCKLTINTFDGGRKFISGNRCEKPVTDNKNTVHYNMFEYKKQLLDSYHNFEGKRQSVGIPLGLNMYELLPFWHSFFKTLGFGVVISGHSTRELYLRGQHTIPSDTVCYPAKIIHGHIEELIDKGVDAVFYPCMSYNLDEDLGDNHYNCPVVAYYPEVIGANVSALKSTPFIGDYLGLHRRRDFPKKIHALLQRYFGNLSLREVKIAADNAYAEHNSFMDKVRKKGEQYLRLAIEKQLPTIILAGRPYHLDPEINHGIDKLICDSGSVLLTEDAVSHLAGRFSTTVLNQWTYHSRLYAAAHYITETDYRDIHLVQLVSFGCGVDAITTDEIRKILEAKGKIYTQIKIDEITNLGAVNIRLRSLFAAAQEKNNEQD